MKISIAAIDFDLLGHVTINTLSDDIMGDTIRRGNIINTLDGGVAVNDYGYSDGGREVGFAWRAVSRAKNEQIDRLVQLHPVLRVCIRNDVYRMRMESFTPDATESSMILRIITKESA